MELNDLLLGFPGFSFGSLGGSAVLLTLKLFRSILDAARICFPCNSDIDFYIEDGCFSDSKSSSALIGKFIVS